MSSAVSPARQLNQSDEESSRGRLENQIAGAAPRTFWVPESADEPPFLAYSITKTFTASLALKLCEQGRLSLGEPITRWPPASSGRSESVFVNFTLADLVSLF